ncbi:MAG: DUF721 domain-containing protein [Bacteroidia bacterium]
MAERLGELLQAFLANQLADKPLLEARLQEVWPALVGQAAAQATRALRVRKRTLIVYVEDALVREALTFQVPGLLRALQEKGLSQIARIEVRLSAA